MKECQKSSLVLFFLLLTIGLSGQNISGQILSSSDEKLGYASISAYQSDSTFIKGTYSDADGKFKLFLPPGNYFIEAGFVGYRSEVQEIEVIDKAITLKFILQNNNLLDEIQITEKKIGVKVEGDTTTFILSTFEFGNEKKLEDVLLTLPGFQINESKQILYNNKVINKILIDKQELFLNHKNALENINSESIQDIQIIDKFSNKWNISKQAKQVALNINTKKEKFTIHGAPYLSCGTNQQYNIKLNLYSFSNRLKFALLGNANNLQYLDFGLEDYLSYSGILNDILNSGKNRIKYNYSFPKFLTDQNNNREEKKVFVALNSSYKSEKFNILNFLVFNKGRRLMEQLASQNYSDSLTILSNEVSSGSKFNNFILQNTIEYNLGSKTNAKLNNRFELNKSSTLDNIISINKPSFNTENLYSDKTISTELSVKNNLASRITVLSSFGYIFHSNNDDFQIMSQEDFLNLDFEGGYQVIQNKKIKNEELNFNLKVRYDFKKYWNLIFNYNAYRSNNKIRYDKSYISNQEFSGNFNLTNHNNNFDLGIEYLRGKFGALIELNLIRYNLRNQIRNFSNWEILPNLELDYNISAIKKIRFSFNSFYENIDYPMLSQLYKITAINQIGLNNIINNPIENSYTSDIAYIKNDQFNNFRFRISLNGKVTKTPIIPTFANGAVIYLGNSRSIENSSLLRLSLYIDKSFGRFNINSTLTIGQSFYQEVFNHQLNHITNQNIHPKIEISYSIKNKIRLKYFYEHSFMRINGNFSNFNFSNILSSLEFTFLPLENLQLTSKLIYTQNLNSINRFKMFDMNSEIKYSGFKYFEISLFGKNLFNLKTRRNQYTTQNEQFILINKYQLIPGSIGLKVSVRF